jgi:WD40 repeat protein
MDDPETLYNPPPPPSRLAAGPTPPRRSGSGPPASNGTGDLNGVESGDEDEDDDEGVTLPAMTTQAQRMLDDFPDSTNANRRPPSFMPDVHINPTHHIHAYAVHGRHVCTASHHVKVYDTLMSSHPILVVDLKDTGIEFRIKEPRVTAMGFRPARHLADEGRYLWCGTKDGHLWELDIRTGEVTDTRQGVHNSAVSHILRYRNYLMTLEENGKLHVFQVDTEKDVPLTLLRTVRVSDRFTFAKLICGRLWTASAPPSRSTTNSASKGPTIRVYEPCAEGVMPPARTIYATEWTGAVTSATMIPFRPSEVFLAHEGGYISVWDVQEYTCLQVLKISSTDILALEGVGERLWTGNRKGQIHVYDISNKPWKTTNVWTTHQYVSSWKSG